MRNRNTCGMIEYLLENVYWNLIVLWFYRNVLFCVVPGLAYARSVTVLNALVALGISSGYLFTFRSRRNGMSIFTGIACSFGTYFVLSLWQAYRRSIAWVLGISLGLIVLYLVMVAVNYTRDRKSGKTDASVWRCIGSSLLGARTILGMAMVALMIGCWTGLAAAGRDAENLSFGEQKGSALSYEGNMETVLLLQEHEWEGLELAERLSVLQIIADIECGNLGIQALKVCAKPTDEDTLGYYTDNTRTVTINMDHLASGSAGAVLDTLYHEVFHGYEYRLAEIYSKLDEESKALRLFADASCYSRELANYIQPDEDLEGYIMQKTEVDADCFAAGAVSDVYNLIDYHNGNRGSSE